MSKRDKPLLLILQCENGLFLMSDDREVFEGVQVISVAADENNICAGEEIVQPIELAEDVMMAIREQTGVVVIPQAWQEFVTSAPTDYDGFSTRTVGMLPYRSKPGRPQFRRVAILGRDLQWQRGRCRSGLYPFLTPAEFADWVRDGIVMPA